MWMILIVQNPPSTAQEKKSTLIGIGVSPGNNKTGRSEGKQCHRFMEVFDTSGEDPLEQEE